jgi:hypothetical protein
MRIQIKSSEEVAVGGRRRKASSIRNAIKLLVKYAAVISYSSE